MSWWSAVRRSTSATTRWSVVFETPGPAGKRRSVLRTFVTFTTGVEELADWLAATGVSEVVMEATAQ